ncbi:MAG: hypothetical protein Q9201_006977 [Fulgogasparrea decipioides]
MHIRIYSIRYDPGVEPFVYAENLSLNGVEWLQRQGMTWDAFRVPHGQAVLLSDGDKLRLCDQTTFIFQTRLPASQLLTSTQLQDQQNPDCRQVLEKAAFDNLFIMTNRKLGSGISGRVFMVIDRVWRRQMACKIVQLKACHSHKPNIITIDRVFYTDYNLYIVEELVTGGDLMSYIERHDCRIDPNEACLVVYQLLQAVFYLHENGITHRDLKPENILMSTTATGARVILTDFGTATKTAGKGVSKRMQTITGTANYLAPEIRGNNRLVQQPGYTSAVDMWSVGCVAAAMLIGRSPFALSQISMNRRPSAAAVIAASAICDTRVLDNPEVWGDIDVRARDFIRRLLVLDERKRLTADQALVHVWFIQGTQVEPVAARYDRAIAGWRPSGSSWDFKEHLDRFIEGRIPENDVRSTCLFTMAGHSCVGSHDDTADIKANSAVHERKLARPPSSIRSDLCLPPACSDIIRRQIFRRLVF